MKEETLKIQKSSNILMNVVKKRRGRPRKNNPVLDLHNQAAARNIYDHGIKTSSSLIQPTDEQCKAVKLNIFVFFSSKNFFK